MPPRSSLLPFVGRQQELTTLSALLAAARQGEGSVVLVGGEPGIGKTRLAEEFTALARTRSFTVAWGRCYEGAGAPAYWPWLQILRAPGVAPAPEDQLPLEDRADLAIVAQILPQLRDRYPDLPRPVPPPDADTARFQLLDAVCSLLCRCSSRQPLVVVLDDLQWADLPSLLVLELLAPALQDHRMLVCATFRDVAIASDQPLPRTLGALARLPCVTRFSLSGLSADEVATLLIGVGQTPLAPELAAILTARAEGNPLFVRELLQLVSRTGDTTAAVTQLHGVPQTLREVIGRRLASLASGGQHCLAVAALIGRTFDMALLMRAAGSDPEHILAQLDEAELARLIEPAGAAGEYRFTHALIRETLEELPPHASRAALHRRIGEALEAAARPPADGQLRALAHHFHEAIAAGGAAKAMHYARAAADRALALLAYEDAARLYTSALRACEVADGDPVLRCDLLLALGVAYERAGAVESARETMQAAAAVAREYAVLDRLARAALNFGAWGSVTFGVPDPVLVALLEEALGALDAGDSGMRVQLLSALSRATYYAEPAGRSLQLARDALALARGLADGPALAAALNAACVAYLGPDGPEERQALAGELIRVADATGARGLVLEGHQWRVLGYLQVGDGVAAEAEIRAYAERAAAYGQRSVLWYAALLQAMHATLRGDFAAAERLVDEARRLGVAVHPGNATMLATFRCSSSPRRADGWPSLRTPCGRWRTSSPS